MTSFLGKDVDMDPRFSVLGEIGVSLKHRSSDGRAEAVHAVGPNAWKDAFFSLPQIIPTDEPFSVPQGNFYFALFFSVAAVLIPWFILARMVIMHVHIIFSQWRVCPLKCNLQGLSVLRDSPVQDMC